MVTSFLGLVLSFVLIGLSVILGFVIEELWIMRKNRKFEELQDMKREDLN
jgi:uncharacterized membrane protein (DUF485 family)